MVAPGRKRSKDQDGGEVAVLRRRIDDLQRIANEKRAIEQRLKHESARADLLDQVVLQCQTAPNPNEAFRCALQGMCQHIGWPVGHVYLPQSDRDKSLLSSGIWYITDPPRFQDFRELTEGSALSRSGTLPGRAITRRRPVWISDITRDETFVRKHSGSPVRSALALPIIVDGQVHAVLEFFSPDVHDEPNETLLAVSREISSELGRLIERKRAEEALRRSENRFRYLAQQTPIPIVTFDCQGMVLFVNRAAQRMLGYTEGDMVGQPIVLFVDRRYRGLYRRAIQRLAHNRGERLIDKTFEGQVLHRDGYTIPVEFAVGVYMDQGEGCFSVVFHDVSARRETEVALRRAQSRLRKLMSQLNIEEQNERRRLAEQLHEHVAQLLAVSKLTLERLPGELQADELSRRIENVSAMIERALHDTRILSYELSPPVLFDMKLPTLIEWVAHQMHSRHGLEVSIDQADDLPELSDEGRILAYQALHEALSNVAQHADVTRATVTARREEDYVLIRVQDQGVGFDARRLGQEETQEEGGEEGPGTGLPAMRERLSAHGGRVEIVSMPGGAGTRVDIRLPY